MKERVCSLFFCLFSVTHSSISWPEVGSWFSNGISKHPSLFIPSMSLASVDLKTSCLARVHASSCMWRPDINNTLCYALNTYYLYTGCPKKLCSRGISYSGNNFRLIFTIKVSSESSKFQLFNDVKIWTFLTYKWLFLRSFYVNGALISS